MESIMVTAAPLRSLASAAQLLGEGKASSSAVPGSRAKRAYWDPRGRDRKKGTAQGHLGRRGVGPLPPAPYSGQLRAESWTRVGIAAHCRIIMKQGDQRKKGRSTQGAGGFSSTGTRSLWRRLCTAELLSQPYLPP